MSIVLIYTSCFHYQALAAPRLKYKKRDAKCAILDNKDKKCENLPKDSLVDEHHYIKVSNGTYSYDTINITVLICPTTGGIRLV